MRQFARGTSVASLLRHSERGPDGLLGVPPARLVDTLDAIRAAGLRDVLQVTADALRDLLGGDLVVVATRTGEDLVARAVSGGYPDAPSVGHHVPITGTLAGVVFATGSGQICLDASEDPRSNPAVNARFRIGSSLAAPLLQDGEVQGVVSVLSQQTGSFGTTDLQLLELSCGTAADRLAHLVGSAGLEALGRTVLDSLDEAVLVTTGDRMEVMLTNRALDRILGPGVRLPPGTVLLDHGWQLWDEQGRPIPADESPGMVAWRSGEEVRDRVCRVRHGDGDTFSERWLTVTSLPVLDPLSRQVVSVVNRLRDVTEERRDREQLLASRERLHAAQEVTGLAWWEYDVRADRHGWSEQMFRIAGLDPAGEPPDGAGWLALMHPDDRVTADLGGAGPSDAGLRDAQMEVFRLTRADGVQRVLQSWSQREYATDGSLLRIYGATLDVTEREDAVRAVESRDDRLRLAFDCSPIGMSLLDGRPGHQGRLLRANPALVRLLGYDDEEELLGMTVGQWTVTDDVEADTDRLRRLFSGELVGAQYEKRYRRRDGGTVSALVTSSVSGQGGGSPVLLSHVLDLTEREKASRALAANEQQFRVAFEKAPTGMLLISGGRGNEGVILRANQAFADMVQRPVDELVGVRAQDLLVDEDVRASYATLARVVTTNQDSGRVHRRVRRSDGTVRDVWSNSAVVDPEAPDGPHVLTHVVDVTTQHHQQRALERLALTDPVTGLANRRQLSRWVDSALTRIDPEAPGAVALLMLDLDRFKTVNDSLGHHIGDELLVQVAHRLRVGAAADPRWSVARIGGDEFVVLLEGLSGPEPAEQAAREVLALLAEPVQLDSGHRMTTTVSVGIALATDPTHTRENLLREADLALYAAKDAGRNGYALCDVRLRDAVQLRVATESRLREALEDGRLAVHLQPVVDLADGSVVSFEALVRLVDPDGSLVLPGEFIQVAEDTGLVADVDRFVLAEGLRLLSSHPRLVADPSLRLSVNLSGRTLQHPGLAETVAAGLAEHGVLGSRLTLEITERSLLEDNPQVHDTMSSLRALGAALAIDDFGTGYSALAYLRTFDLQQLKVDRSFVAGLGDEVATATVQAIIDVAHAHRLEVVAEGVEEQWQAEQLRSMGCDQAQGWLFGRPAPADGTT